MISVLKYLPSEDGPYLTYIGEDSDGEFLGGHFQVLNYCQGHWNCHIDSIDGTLYDEAEIKEVTHWDFLPHHPLPEECLNILKCIDGREQE